MLLGNKTTPGLKLRKWVQTDLYAQQTIKILTAGTKTSRQECVEILKLDELLSLI